MDIETRYALSGKLNIAYQVVGEGEPDLLFVPAFMSNIELSWEQPSIGRFFGALASFTRVIQFDRRGNGSSDGAAGPTPLESRSATARSRCSTVPAARSAARSRSATA